MTRGPGSGAQLRGRSGFAQRLPASPLFRGATGSHALSGRATVAPLGDLRDPPRFAVQEASERVDYAHGEYAARVIEARAAERFGERRIRESLNRWIAESPDR